MDNLGPYNEISKTTLLLIFASVLMVASCGAGNFHQDVDVTWGGERAKIRKGGHLLSLSLDQFSGSGFQSKAEFLFGRIDVQLRLISGNSAGTVAAFYLSSRGPTHDEIDFEFLGNVSGQPYTVHTNVFTQGLGNREQQFRLWFDPTSKFHTYSVIWNPQNIVFLVDKIPIRLFKNEERRGIPYPKDQLMRAHSSLWKADDWATQGGLVKTDWSNAPFTVFYKHLNIMTQASCVVSSSPSSSSASPCASSPANSSSGAGWWKQGVDAVARRSFRWVQKHYMIYNYCTDFKRFPHCLPPECKR